MRVMQSYMPISGMLGKGIDPAECAIWPKDVLIDDGAAIGHAAEEDDLLNQVGQDYGVLLSAKNVDTMLRGLEKIRQDQKIGGKSGLAVVAMRYDAGGGSKLRKGLTVGAKFVGWMGHRGAQGVLQGGFDMVDFFTRVHYFTGARDIGPSIEGYRYGKGKKNRTKVLIALGGKPKVTWDSFKANHVGDPLDRKCVMLLVCSTSHIKNSEGGSNGIVAIRNINSSLTVAELRGHAAKAFKGESKSGGGQMFQNMGDWDEI